MKLRVELDLIPSTRIPGSGSFGKYSYYCCLCGKKTSEDGWSYQVNVLGKNVVVCACDSCIEKHKNSL